MGYGQRLRMQRSADGRVLKAQLNLIGDVLHAARFSAPLWALAAALLASEIGVFGDAPLASTLFLPLAVGIATFAAVRMVGLYRGDTAAHASHEKLEPWFARFIALQIAISSAWGLMPWLLWQNDSPINHVFLAFACVAILSWLVVSRVSHVDMFMASVVPMLAMCDLRFLFGGTLLDVSVAAVLTIYAGADVL